MNYDMLRGHRARLREKFLNSGMKALHDYEILELLLTFVIPRRDVKPIAKALLDKSKKLYVVFDALPRELRQIKGIGETAPVLFVFVRELCTAYLESKAFDVDCVNSPQAVIDFSRMKIGGKHNEFFMVLYLNTQNHIIDYDCQEGTVNRAAVYPRNIVRRCMELHVCGIIIVHNHPSGVCDPSPADRRLTESIKKAVDMVEVKLLDHIIVSRAGYSSFIEMKIL
ncbi:MAG: DNA repair protein RadC [Victivallaceae bacterium]|nr:DNA repair protein RadC [Victivallaceae bacterium]